MNSIEELRHNARLVVRELGLLADAYQNIGVTLAERHLLIELKAQDNHTVKSIAALLLLEKSSASRLIARAVKKGFVTYKDDSADKRRRPLEITAKGLETLKAFETVAQKQVVDALSFLSTDEADKVFQGMALFAKALKKARE
ncbi:MAG: MarR family transcriptional regulator [Verrucomicrobia bacterium]|nr:MarR family transcriptional regulator [Verrucomicrobiota bacterium]MBS0636276.1 MarR family transcriptional regulator [Verrucomicrobiota bacterium]